MRVGEKNKLNKSYSPIACKGEKSLEGYEHKNYSLIVKEKKIGGEITKILGPINQFFHRFN